MRETWGSNTLDFFYDAMGTPYAIKYNGTLYYYITNLQGDVLHIVNTSGTPVVSYTYSPYGKVLSTTGTLASTLGVDNPLRYRGYYYDTDSGLYYLQSRYYDPELGRFLNADSYASTGQGLLGHNMFVYCNNNPIVFIDCTGEKPCQLNCMIYEGGAVKPNKEQPQRDVTEEILSALEQAVNEAIIRRKIITLMFGDNPYSQMLVYYDFYLIVNHNAAWDIKRPEPWESTIRTPYPGFDTHVVFGGINMTPEQLGNFTYGFLGYAYDIPLEHLITGSYYAAGFPSKGNALWNELFDWYYVILGYESAVAAYEPQGG